MKKIILAALMCGAAATNASAQISVSFLCDGNVDGHDFVDLGLTSGTLWATKNIGADDRDDEGDFFAWGETADKESYDWTNYAHCDGSSTTFTKYCNSASQGKDGYTDELTVLEAADDAAAANWGGAWTMPTDAQLTELKNECYWVWTSNYNSTGVAGVMVFEAKADADKGKFVKSDAADASYKTTSTHIFLPAAGYAYEDNITSGTTTVLLWSSTMDSTPTYGWCLTSSSSGIYHYSHARCHGLTVRAVHPGEATRASDATADKKDEVKKIMRDGVVYITKGDEVYGANGNRVK